MKTETLVRLRVTVEGIVQGVGFRPFACRLARSLALAGWVGNRPSGVVLEVEGPSDRIDMFVRRLRTDAPASARIENLTTSSLPLQQEDSFSIRTSDDEGAKRLAIAPDLALCDDCARELFDPADRRFRYPFMTCAQCGPRFSLVTGIPYDRPNTTMAGFSLCSACEEEYKDVEDRRFHAEPIACPDCGPTLALWDADGRPVQTQQAALEQACAMIRQGGIVAVKGIGGFLLMADAGSESAVQKLRDRKHRPHKPFAVMFPSLDAVRAACELSNEEQGWLTSPRRPIVLLRRRGFTGIAGSVAPGNPTLGALLPYAPLHHLIMEAVQRPLVATSGNRSEEPIVFDEQEALRRLGGIADAFLVHDRPIARPVDDSVLRIAGSQPILLRRARGFVPQTIMLKGEALGCAAGPILAVGGHLKNTVAMLDGSRVLVSQHLGDLGTVESDAAFHAAIEDLQHLLAKKPLIIACDLHPDYRSTEYAHRLSDSLGIPLVQVQHHHAHIAACMAEHHLDGEVLGIAWDGAGYGTDGTIWGGEFLRAGYKGFSRVAHLRPFRLPGGEAAAREPRRSALTVLRETLGEEAIGTAPGFDRPDQAETVATLLRKQLHAPVATSMGRLFDAVASLLGLCQVSSFEGQAAMAVEFAAMDLSGEDAGYPIELCESKAGAACVADWRPMIKMIVDDLEAGVAPARISFRFHLALAELAGLVATRAGLPRVVLSGGCFQNALLAGLVRTRLEREGFHVFTHREVPPNDGGLSLGQAVIAAHGSPTGRG